MSSILRFVISGHNNNDSKQLSSVAVAIKPSMLSLGNLAISLMPLVDMDVQFRFSDVRVPPQVKDESKAPSTGVP